MVDSTNSGEQCASTAFIQKYAIGTITCGRYLPELNLGKDRKRKNGHCASIGSYTEIMGIMKILSWLNDLVE
jgi:hypothetical protein